MKKAGLILFALMLALSARAQDLQQVMVTGDRVSLRAAPEVNAVLLDRAMSGDQLLLVDNSNPEWVGVRPPQKINFWVNADYIEDEVVVPARLNVRSGPSRSHGVVGIVSRGEKLVVRGALEDWVRIAPPETTLVWISRRYTNFAAVELAPVELANPMSADEPVLITGTEAPVTEKESNIIITIEPVEPIVADVVEVKPASVTVLQPVINDLMIVASEVVELPEALTPDPSKEQGVAAQFAGILQPANSMLYKLVDPKFERVVVCYVRGNPEQLKTYAGRSLILSGRVYWAAGLEQAFLVPEKIEVLP
ncbi:MAG: SH3 domain-containing protein [Victivallales bacterium]|nr:SH3 domain-containing protein [Victivallales bacterium]